MATQLSKAEHMAWRRFITSEAGVNGMLFLRERTPSIHKGDSSSIILDAGKVEGYRICLDLISEIIAAEPKKQVNLENE